jgi:hypothetical protein
MWPTVVALVLPNCTNYLFIIWRHWSLCWICTWKWFMSQGRHMIDQQTDRLSQGVGFANSRHGRLFVSSKGFKIPFQNNLPPPPPAHPMGNVLARMWNISTNMAHWISPSGRWFMESKYSFLNLNDGESKRLFCNMQSKISHKSANLVLICESQSNQRRPCLTWDLVLHFLTRWFQSIIGWKQLIDLMSRINEFDVWSRNGMTALLLHIRSFIPKSFYFMLFSTCRLLCQLTSLVLYCSLGLPRSYQDE